MSLGGDMPMCSTVFSTGVVATINDRTCLAIRVCLECVERRGRAVSISEAALEGKRWWPWVFLCHLLLHVVNTNKCEVLNLAQWCVLLVQGCLMESLHYDKISFY